MGLTFGFNSLEQNVLPKENFKATSELSSNWSLGVKFFHKNDWISSFDFGKYHPTHGAAIVRDGRITRLTSHQQVILNLGFVSTTFRVGKFIRPKDPSWQLGWLAGINLDYVEVRSSGGGIIFPAARKFAIVAKEYSSRAGVFPALQAGYQAAFRGKRMGVSWTIIGNLGLKHYRTQYYEAWIEEVGGIGKQKFKGDFIAGMVQYEVYIGKRKK